MDISLLRDRGIHGLKNAAKATLSRFNLAIIRIDPEPACTLEWIAEAQADGMAVNDFIEKDHREPALSELEKLVFPRISPESIVCELGPGTGIYTRYINECITAGEFHIVDSDPNAIGFLKKHLPKSPRTHLYRNSGMSLPFRSDPGIDLAFCASVFMGGNLSNLYGCAQEFSRVLRRGGYLVFDYFDISTEAGWGGLTRKMARKRPLLAYTYHSTETVNNVLDLQGFEIVGRYLRIRGSVFVTAQKL